MRLMYIRCNVVLHRRAVTASGDVEKSFVGSAFTRGFFGYFFRDISAVTSGIQIENLLHFGLIRTIYIKHATM